MLLPVSSCSLELDLSGRIRRRDLLGASWPWEGRFRLGMGADRLYPTHEEKSKGLVGIAWSLALDQHPPPRKIRSGSQ